VVGLASKVAELLSLVVEEALLSQVVREAR
jgi:hypothetical protein